MSESETGVLRVEADSAATGALETKLAALTASELRAHALPQIDGFDFDASNCAMCGSDSCPGDCPPEAWAAYGRACIALARLPASTASYFSEEQDAVDSYKAKAKASNPKPGPPPPRFVRASSLVGEPPAVSISDDIPLFPGRVSVLVGESAAGKTFVALWAAQRLDGATAYVSFESDAFGQRVAALEEAVGHPLDNLHILRVADPLSPRVARDGVEASSMGEAIVSEAVEALLADPEIKAGPPIRLVVVDTVRASLSGSEDSSETVSAYLRACRRILALIPGAACLLVHHSGWQDGEQKRKRERGSSAFRGNVDATCYLELDREDREAGLAWMTLTSVKVRDGERFAPLRLIRRRVTLAAVHGSSCIIEVDHSTPSEAQAAETASVAALAASTDAALVKAIAGASPTSMNALRAALGVGTEVLTASLARCLTGGLVLMPLKKGFPYRLTTAGEGLL